MAKNKKENDVLLSESEVWDILQFARAYNPYFLSGYSPELTSQIMKSISYNPMQATEKSLEKSMVDPRNNEEALQYFSQDFELQSMVYKRLLSYLANIPSFDITYTSDVESKNYKTPRYKRDLKEVEDFLDNFDYKNEFRIVTKQLLRNDVFFGCLREVENSYIIQELPTQYCKITGRWAHGYLFSFNMQYFLNPGTDIHGYPEFFQKKYKELFIDSDSENTNTYKPWLSSEKRGLSSWAYWVDVPVHVGTAFKLTQELAVRLPYFTPLFSDLVLQTAMRNLQKDSNLASASKMIIGEVPMLKGDTKATVRDSIAISPKLLGEFMSIVKSSISDSIRMASAPLENMQAISFDTNNDMYDKYLKTALSSSGVNTNLIFSSDLKPNVTETQLSLNVDEQLMTSLYSQFEGFLNYYVGKKTNTYRFKFKFEGTNFYTDRTTRFNNAMKLFNVGIVLPQKIAASIGMKPADLRRHMEESKANNFMDDLMQPSVAQAEKLNDVLPQPSSQPSSLEIDKKAGTGDSRGRPRKNDMEISEEGSATREKGSNISRGGQV